MLGVGGEACGLCGSDRAELAGGHLAAAVAGLGEAEAAALAEAAAMAAAGGNPMAPPQTGADIMDINAEKSMELRKTVRQFVNNNPEIAAQMLKTWLRAGKEEGNA